MIYSLKYTDDMPAWQGGYARAWFVRIRPKHRDDQGLLQHELTHVRQFWRSCGLHGILLLFKTYRLKAEVEAYRKQLEYAPAGSINTFAVFIATRYDLGITIEEALKALQ